MTQLIVEVGYQYVYDLYYRVRHARLESEIYRMEFLDWIKAGIAYNTLGVNEPSRKVSYFVKLYKILETGVQNASSRELRTAVMRFYEDLFQLYQDHLLAQLQIAHKRGKSTSTEPSNLILLPSFAKTPELYDVLPSEDVVLKEYEGHNIEELRRRMSTVYAVQGSPLFRCMSLLFDYGVRGEGDGTLLGVK